MAWRSAKRSTAENARSGEAGRDLAWAVVGCVAAVVLAVLTGLGATVTDALKHSPVDLSAVIGLVLVLPLAAAVIARRRYRDANAVRDELDRLALHDPLTALPNRRFLNERFEQIIRRSQRAGGRVAVFVLDLDRLKNVNEAHGREAGDQLIVAVTTRLAQLVGEASTVVRYGGGEFVVICPDTTGGPSAERLAATMIEGLEAPFSMGHDRVRLAANIGIAIAEENCSQPDDLIRDARSALNKAKQGPGGYAMFDRSIAQRVTPSTTERRLREALERGQFRLHYQPVVSLQTQRMVKVEALIRWEDPERGLVSPGEFIPALEETGLIVPVGTWVLEEACRQAKRWQETYADRAPLAVTLNVSTRQLAQYDFPDVLTRALTVTQVDPSLICLEITEGALMHDVEAAWTMLRTAKTRGVALALDDFGTGFSSLSFLRKFSMDILKIDKSFVDGLGHSREDTTIVEHLIGMARGLGMVTVAEGVETADQVKYLRSLDCHMAQGFYYCKPQPAEVIDQIMGEPTTTGWRPEQVPATNGAHPSPATIGIDAPW
ncbi:MAG: bifunctional diguanylate cyclase/phosphodiesterase [Acidimicrobiales bacterium]|nr:bifunctional diguanylate cyclase/phosphodiesterase [Acidimicrobiales bacterium]